MIILLALPSLAGCVATGSLVALGNKHEYKFFVDAVGKSKSESSYLVEYTATVGLSTIGGGHTDEKRYQVLVPRRVPAPSIKQKPPGFAGATSIPMRRVGSAGEIRSLSPGEDHMAYVVDKERLVLLTRDRSQSEVIRTDFAFTELNYKEPYAYPVMLLEPVMHF